MLGGLEVSEVQFNDAIYLNRFDSEYFQKEFIIAEKTLLKLAHSSIGDSYKVTDGEHGSVVFLEQGVKYLTAENIKQGYVDTTKIRYVDKSVDVRNARARVNSGDILISIKGTLGEVAIAEEDLLPANMNRDVAILKSSHSSKFHPVFLMLFLMSKYGAIQSLRGGSGGVQQMITLERLRNFVYPQFTESLLKPISEVFKKSQQCRKISSESYAQSETLLLSTLNMSDFSPSTEAVNIKSFKDSFAATGRLDAEYYQLKYEEVVSKITTHSHARLIDLVSIQKSIEPGSDAYSDDESGLPFLRVADYSKHGITKPQKRLNAAFIAENSDDLDALKPKKDTILFSKDGSVGEAYCLREDGDFITSGAVLHLKVRNPKVVLPEYLTLALNSKLVKMQAERDAGGSIILHWRVGEVASVVVPLVDMPTQTKIAALVQQSFTLKAGSERLLEVAKRAVEIAIEQDEKAGFAYIEANA